MKDELLWLWSYGSWICNYPCDQCLSSLKLWVRIPLRQCELDTTLCDIVCQWLSAGWWFSNKTDCHNIAEILLKVALNTITLTPQIKDHLIFMHNLCLGSVQKTMTVVTTDNNVLCLFTLNQESNTGSWEPLV